MFKDNFIRLCNKRRESPCSVCQKVGITSATFSKWTDESVPHRATLMRISDYLGVSIQELLAETPNLDSADSWSSENICLNDTSPFWQNLIQLCAEKGVSPTFVCHELNLSNATSTKWKKGAAPRHTTVKKIADYFNVSPDFLLKDPTIKTDSSLCSLRPDCTQPRSVPDRLLAIINIMTEEELENLEIYAAFLISRQK